MSQSSSRAVDTAIDLHVTELRRMGRRPMSVNQRFTTLRRFRRHIAPLDLFDADYQMVATWIFEARHLAPETQAVEVTHFRQFYQWAVEAQFIEKNPVLRLRRPRVPMGLPRPMATDDLARAIHQAPDRIRPWLLLAAYAGLRCGEIAQLRAEDIWWDVDPAVIIIVTSKGGDTTSVPMSPYLAEHLAACGLPAKGWLFRRHDGKPGPNAPYLISQVGNEYLHCQGIPDTMHSVRHWFGTETLRATKGNLRVTQEAMRHKSIMSTQRYTAIVPTEVAEALTALPHLMPNRRRLRLAPSEHEAAS